MTQDDDNANEIIQGDFDNYDGSNLTPLDFLRQQRNVQKAEVVVSVNEMPMDHPKALPPTLSTNEHWPARSHAFYGRAVASDLFSAVKLNPWLGSSPDKRYEMYRTRVEKDTVERLLETSTKVVFGEDAGRNKVVRVIGEMTRREDKLEALKKEIEHRNRVTVLSVKFKDVLSGMGPVVHITPRSQGKSMPYQTLESVPEIERYAAHSLFAGMDPVAPTGPLSAVEMRFGINRLTSDIVDSLPYVDFNAESLRPAYPSGVSRFIHYTPKQTLTSVKPSPSGLLKGLLGGIK